MRLIDADNSINRLNKEIQNAINRGDAWLSTEPTVYEVDEAENCDIMQINFAKQILGTFMYAWCDKNKPDESEFNCERCAFKTEDGRCLAKAFLKSNEPIKKGE